MQEMKSKGTGHAIAQYLGKGVLWVSSRSTRGNGKPERKKEETWQHEGFVGTGEKHEKRRGKREISGSSKGLVENICVDKHKEQEVRKSCTSHTSN